MSAPVVEQRLLSAPRLVAPTGSQAFLLPGVGFVWDYRDWTGSAHAKPRWGAAYKPDLHARCAVTSRLGFRSRSAAVSWLLSLAMPSADAAGVGV
ncbi:hypothetical protein SAMN06264364_12098 [Quadrisphaera granulorum]|uniref:Uncharacterized protein n=1 Tax=Quadrisphaera granulorum TaxID=317664 RepID=A0A316A2M1_9ACTN|nr:hypothetical protein [Quadrisphaera granulorum]PWJ51819.1 hypothetical protein BXY45_12098 [Quadrisphaera granulorum]SZE97766.1 hypothetical protein SAMN06264364_12098 [Quadrisphaera granulorum]